MKIKNWFSVILIGLLLCKISLSQDSKTQIEVTKLYKNLYKFLVGTVSVVASIGSEGILLSDAALESDAKQLHDELRKISGNKIKYDGAVKSQLVLPPQINCSLTKEIR